MIDKERLIKALYEECEKDIYKEIPSWILKVIEKQSEVGEWIPCSVALPNPFEDVLVWYEYYRYGDYNCMYQTYDISIYDNINKTWYLDGNNAKCLAWQPLPKPYQEKPEFLKKKMNISKE